MQRKKLNVGACNFEQVRGVIRDIEANFAAVFEEMRKLRAAQEARLPPPEPSGARPT